MNLPNSLTILRIFFVPLLVAALMQENVYVRLGSLTITNEWLALAIFLIAAGTDLLDGYLARRWKQVTTIGTLLDPIADKLLISAALISLVQVRVLPGWMAILIIGREFAVSGLRSIAAAEGYTIKASDLGKTKMFAQVVAIACMLISVRHPALLADQHVPDVGRDLLRPALRRQLFPEVLAPRGRARQEAPPARTAAAGTKTPEGADASEGDRAGRRTGLGAATIWKPPEVN